MDMGLSKFWDSVMEREDWRAEVHGIAKSQTWMSDWTELNIMSRNHIAKYNKQEGKIEQKKHS